MASLSASRLTNPFAASASNCKKKRLSCRRLAHPSFKGAKNSSNCRTSHFPTTSSPFGRLFRFTCTMHAPLRILTQFSLSRTLDTTNLRRRLRHIHWAKMPDDHRKLARGIVLLTSSGLLHNFHSIRHNCFMLSTNSRTFHNKQHTYNLDVTFGHF